MHKGPLIRRYAISTVLLLGLVFSNSAFAAAQGKRADDDRIDGAGAQGPMRPFGSHRKRFAGPDHLEGTRERRLGTRLQLQSRTRRPVPGRGGLFAGRAVILWSLRLHGNGK